MLPVRSWKPGVSPRHKAATVRERYDRALLYAHDKGLPPDVPRPLPTSHWPEENIQLLERFYAWLISGGTSESTTNTLYLPIAGHALGLNLFPHEHLALGPDLERALDYVREKGVGHHWLKVCQNGLNKFRQFLRLERKLDRTQAKARYDIAAHSHGLPAWLVRELVNFQHSQSRSQYPARVEQNIYRFWNRHLSVWRFLCGQCGVRHFVDVKTQHLLDYIDRRLNAGYAVASVNNEVRAFHSFLRYLEEQGYTVPKSLLRVPGLKAPDTLPKFLMDEQVKKLQDFFERRVAHAKTFHHQRNALLDRAIFYLLWQSGLRLAEVEDLCLEDLDISSHKLTVRNSKGSKDRTVFLADRVLLALKEYLSVRGTGHCDRVFLYRNAPPKKIWFVTA